MKRIICLCFVLLCSVTFTFSQGTAGKKNKPKQTVKKTSPVSLLSKAKTAWTPFWAKFTQAVKEHDHESLKEMMVRNIECNLSSDRSNDTRDECLADWEKSSENNESYVDWEDLMNVVKLGKDAYGLKQEKDYFDGIIKVGKTITPRGESGGSVRFLRFVFFDDKWLLERFSYMEGA